MSKQKKIIIAILAPVCAVILSFIILCFVTIGMYSSVYLGRVLTHWDSSVKDLNYFPSRMIAASDSPYSYEYNLSFSLSDLNIEYKSGNKTKSSNLRTFVENTDTTSFIIVKNDKIVYEQYANGYGKDTLNTSFSMSKSVVSLLIGKAIEEGYIKSVNQPISDFISEFTGLEIGNVTIEQLLSMRSDIEYEEDKFLWFGDDSLTYWYDDLRKLALEHTSLTDKYEGKFHYNNYHPLLLGIIIERSTGLSVSKYFEEKIWKPIGAEFQASWSLDSNESGFEKMESGINFRATDFIKIGSMVLHNGEWNGSRIISGEWLNQSTACEFPLYSAEYSNTFLENRNIGYKYMWYAYPSENSGYDILAWGKSDQILYISPENNTVVLRTGKSDGGVTNWEKVMNNIVNTAF